MKQSDLIYHTSKDYDYLYNELMNGKIFIGFFEHVPGFFKVTELKFKRVSGPKHGFSEYFDIGFVVFKEDLDSRPGEFVKLCEKFKIQFIKP